MRLLRKTIHCRDSAKFARRPDGHPTFLRRVGALCVSAIMFVSLLTTSARAQQQKLLSVTTKAVTPPSGDKHDYLSQAPYFWPDPKSPNGLPYVRRDGERNPELNKITDHQTLDQMEAAVRTLSLAFFLKGNEEYAG